jgi:hypothetical protein
VETGTRKTSPCQMYHNIAIVTTRVTLFVMGKTCAMHHSLDKRKVPTYRILCRSQGVPRYASRAIHLIFGATVDQERNIDRAIGGANRTPRIFVSCLYGVSFTFIVVFHVSVVRAVDFCTLITALLACIYRVRMSDTTGMSDGSFKKILTSSA